MSSIIESGLDCCCARCPLVEQPCPIYGSLALNDFEIGTFGNFVTAHGICKMLPLVQNLAGVIADNLLDQYKSEALKEIFEKASLEQIEQFENTLNNG